MATAPRPARPPSPTPPFLTIVVQPFTFSIANGIYAGLLMSLFLFFLTGNFIPAMKGMFRRQGPGHVVDEIEEPLWSPQRPNSGASISHAVHNMRDMLASADQDSHSEANQYERKSQVVLVNYQRNSAPSL
eukprot:gene9765-7644_t